MRNLKKVLALVLALVMSLSLVTIANASDFADADDITYEEAVDVMTAIGVLEGVGNNEFSPDTILTREQAAAIICRMLLGENAEKLGSTTSSFSDVASTRWSAPYIEYCASLGIIVGNGDGTYSPAGQLTGYAFTKMLLCALGYKADVEGFVGAGWNLKVAAMASKAGLLNDLQGFVGTEAVTREAAAQLALNTLKATLVEYDGTTIDVSTGDANVSIGNTKYTYVTSNNSKINGNIKRENDGNDAAYMTLEFGEQHFTDLKLVSDSSEDDFGNPANHWSLANVTIGKYAKTPEYTYTASVSGNTNLDKLKAMGLNGFKVTDETTLVINGAPVDDPFTIPDGSTSANLNTTANMTALLGDGTDAHPCYVNNGSLVRVFISDDNADVIEAITVVESQIMQVNRVTSSLVTLKRVENSGVTVNAVDDSNENFAFLSGLKADDYVVIVPVLDGASYSVAAAYAPTTATGAITKVDRNAADNATTGVTVDGTSYKMSYKWTAEDGRSSLNGNSVNTSTQSTVYVDQYGYVIYAKDITASTNYFLYDEVYSNIVNNKIHYFAQGWDMSGNAVSLDFGTSNPGLTTGTVYAYKVADNNSEADWAIDATQNDKTIISGQTADIAVNSTSLVYGGNRYYFASNVKFIFPTWNDANTDILSVTTKEGVQKVTSNYTFVLNSTNDIVAVVVTDDTDVEVSSNILYVEKQTSVTNDASGKRVSVFTGYIDGVKAENLVADRIVTADTFYAYAEVDGVYKLSGYSKMKESATSVATGLTLLRRDIENNAYVNNFDVDSTGATYAVDLNFKDAVVVDLTSGFGYNLASIQDMAEQGGCLSYDISIVYNDSAASSSKGRVAYVFITDITTSAKQVIGTIGTDAKVYYDALCTDEAKADDVVYVGDRLYVKSETALKSVTGITGGNSLTLVKAPTAADEAPVYSFLVTGDVSAAVVSGSADWFSTGIFAEAVLDSGALKGSITASVPYANASYEVTYTVTISGTSGAAGASDEITVELTNATGASTLTKVGTPENLGEPTALKVTVIANDTATSGTYTVTATGLSAAVVPDLQYVAK